MEARHLAGDKKKARQEGRTIIFVGESGLTQKPHRRRTWAPRGQTPVLFRHFNWKNLPLIAGLTVWNLYFEMFAESVKAPHIVVFLQHLLRCVPGRLLIVWDGLPAHRAKLVKEFLAPLDGRIHVERLPAYAPELNPAEYFWSYLKQHELPNVCARDLWSLGGLARQKLRPMRRRKRLLTVCWKQSSLSF
jgi:transposase